METTSVLLQKGELISALVLGQAEDKAAQVGVGIAARTWEIEVARELRREHRAGVFTKWDARKFSGIGRAVKELRRRVAGRAQRLVEHHVRRRSGGGGVRKDSRQRGFAVPLCCLPRSEMNQKCIQALQKMMTCAVSLNLSLEYRSIRRCHT